MPELPALYLNPSNGNNFCYGIGCDCNIYALYMSNCFGGFNNNMRIYVNGFYLGDFPASNTSSAWRGFPQQGAPEKCSHEVEAFMRPPFGEGLDPVLGNNTCGGQYGRLFFLNQPTPMRFDPAAPGSKWTTASFSNLIISWHNVPINQGLVSVGNPADYNFSNLLDMYFYLEDYHDGLKACCDSLGTKLFNKPINGCPPGTEENPISECDNFPATLKNTAGGCLGIIRYKKQNNNLTCPKFLPLEEVDAFRYGFVNTFPSTVNNDLYSQFSFFWWDEALLPVSHDPAPSWVENINYYW